MRYLVLTSIAAFTLVCYFGGFTLTSAIFTFFLFFTVYLLSRKRAVLENIKYPILALNFLSLPALLFFPGLKDEFISKFFEFLSVSSPLLLISSFETGRRREKRELIPLILVFASSFANLTLLGSVKLIFILLFGSFIYFFVSFKIPFSISALILSFIAFYLLRMYGIELGTEASSLYGQSKVIILTLLFVYLSLAFFYFVMEKRDDILGKCAFFISVLLMLDLILLFLFSIAGGLHSKPHIVFGLLCLSTASMVKGAETG